MNNLNLFSVAEVELSYKTQVPASNRPRILSSRDAYTIFLKNWNDNKIEHVEELKILLLDRSNRVLGISTISQGGVSSTTADPKIIFQAALKSNASGIIMCHNHPSGNTKPSCSDTALSKKIKKGASLLDISFLDNLIITPYDYYSYTDEGLL